METAELNEQARDLAACGVRNSQAPGWERTGLPQTGDSEWDKVPVNGVELTVEQREPAGQETDLRKSKLFLRPPATSRSRDTPLQATPPPRPPVSRIRRQQDRSLHRSDFLSRLPCPLPTRQVQPPYTSAHPAYGYKSVHCPSDLHVMCGNVSVSPQNLTVISCLTK